MINSAILCCMSDSEHLVLQRYALQHRIQQRDHTETWQAWDAHTQTPVVVKILDLDESPDWQAYAHFEREAEALKTLAHPQIPQFLAFEAETAHQRVVLVQEAITGDSLRVRMDQHRKFTEAQARDLAHQVLGLLHILHQQDPPLIHRDIKPENLLLDEQDQVYLIDFGAVRQFTQNSYTVAGSFSYMAPEQLQGKPIPASDLYGLGMTLIELLSGSPLEGLPREGLYVKFQEHVFVSEGLKRWLEHLVAPYPVQRFASAQAAQQALQSEAYLPQLATRGTLGPSHGKQEITPAIWLLNTKDQCKLEVLGQKIAWQNGLYFFVLSLILVGLWFAPFTLMVINDIYRWIRIPGAGGIGFIFVFTGAMLTFLPLIFWIFLRFLRRPSKNHVLEITGSHLIHHYSKSRGLRREKKCSQRFPLADIQEIRLSPFQIILQRRTGWFKTYRFTLMVPFEPAARTQVAAAFRDHGLNAHG